MPQKIQTIRIQESHCIFNGITSNLTIIHCTYSYAALIVLPTVFSMWACIRAWAMRPELIRVSVNQWCPVSGVEHTNCDATMPPIVFSMAWYKTVKQHSLVVFMYDEKSRLPLVWYICYSPAGTPYWEKLFPRSWVRPEAAGRGLYLRQRAQFFPIRTDQGR